MLEECFAATDRPVTLYKRMMLATWIAFRCARFVLLLSATIILISSIYPMRGTHPVWGTYALEYGLIEKWSGCLVSGNPIIWLVAVISGLASWGFYFASLPDSASGACDCGYDLTGNVSGVCPECGTPTTSPPNTVT